MLREGFNEEKMRGDYQRGTESVQGVDVFGVFISHISFIYNHLTSKFQSNCNIQLVSCNICHQVCLFSIICPL